LRVNKLVAVVLKRTAD